MEPIGINDGPARQQYLGKFLLHFVEAAPPRKACPPGVASDVVARWEDLAAVLYQRRKVDALLWDLRGDMSRVGDLPSHPNFGMIDLLCGLGEAMLEVGRRDEAEAMLDECWSHGAGGCRDSTWRRLQTLRAPSTAGAVRRVAPAPGRTRWGPRRQSVSRQSARRQA